MKRASSFFSVRGSSIDLHLELFYWDLIVHEMNISYICFKNNPLSIHVSHHNINRGSRF
ncbi:hypothetical protein Hdeb2414_s0007g00226481 [Helianthus debilis subsp. tardiflorus]